MGLSPWFAVFLVAALVLSFLLSFMQHLTYRRAAQRLLKVFSGRPSCYLVSGRGKGRLRGAVVLLVIDSGTRQIVAAEVMMGATVFARFHPSPELLGPLAGAAGRVKERRVGDAVDYAEQQYKATLRTAKARAAAAASAA